MRIVISPIFMLTTDVQPTWNLITDIQQILAYPFMQNAVLASTAIAVLAGAIGYFMVLRGQSFAGHTLANVGFAGAAGAVLLGSSPEVGLLLCCVGSALGIDLLSGRGRGQAVAIGTVQTFALGLGLLFVHLASTSNAEGVYAILFGAILGISRQDVYLTAITTTAALAALIRIARPLLFASIDPDVAAVRGVPVRLLARGFLVLLAFAVAQSVQVVGVLLVFALLVTPAAIAQQITARPISAISLAVLLAVLFVWLGLAIAYFTPYPVGFLVTSLAFAAYAIVRLWRSAVRWRTHDAA